MSVITVYIALHLFKYIDSIYININIIILENKYGRVFLY